MIIINKLRFSIDGSSQIGGDNEKERKTIQRLREFMNLLEEPQLSGVSAVVLIALQCLSIVSSKSIDRAK